MGPKDPENTHCYKTERSPESGKVTHNIMVILVLAGHLKEIQNRKVVTS